MPGHQGAVIVGAEAVPVFQDKEVIHGLTKLCGRGKHAAREYVAVHPGIQVMDGTVSTDGMQKENPPRPEAAVGEFDETPVVLVAYMLAQANRGYLVEGARGFPVVLEAEFHGEAFALGTGPFDLRDGNVVCNHLYAIMFRRIARETTPPASELQDLFAGCEGQFPADKVELGFLGGGKVLGGPVPVSARVLHVGIEHGFVECIADVVVDLGNLERALLALPVEKPRLGHTDEYSGAGADLPVVMGGKHPVEELVQGLAVPQAVHVGFSKS